MTAVGTCDAQAAAPWSLTVRDGGAPPFVAQVPSASAAPLPKVALLFLTRGPVPTEPIWEAFLAGAVASDDGSPAWERLFSIYIHPPPGWAFPASSLFAGREVADRVRVEWGQHSLVEAERRLLRAALGDALNQRFVLLSEDSVPLYPAPAVYLQLMAENRSRVDACADPEDPADAERRMDHRWQPAMQEAGLGRELWRKSSQWVELTRAHATVIAEEQRLNAVFAKECWATPEGVQPFQRFCVSDEHYIPSVLAVHRLQGECACDGAAMHTAWPGPTFHPATYGAKDASMATLQEEMRRSGGCNATALLAAAAALLPAPGPLLAGGRDGALAWTAASAVGVVLMPPRCPLFARKVEAGAVREWSHLLEPLLAAP